MRNKIKHFANADVNKGANAAADAGVLSALVFSVCSYRQAKHKHERGRTLGKPTQQELNIESALNLR